MSDFSAYLVKLRQAKGHDSAAKLSSYAKTRGYKITGQAIRNFELGRVPNRESRLILKDILHMSSESYKKFELMCAVSAIQKEWESLDLFVISPANVGTVVKQIGDIVPINDEQRERIRLCLTSPNSIVKQRT